MAKSLTIVKPQPSKPRSPLDQLEKLPGWWQGKINVRVQFRQEELARAQRFEAMTSPQTQHDEQIPIELRAAAPMLARDMAFACMIARRECFAMAAEHDTRITEYQRRMAACGE